MTHEQKQRYKEAKNKRDRDKYHNMKDEERQKYKDHKRKYKTKYENMTDEQKQKLKDYQKEYCKKYYAEKKFKMILSHR